MTTWNKTITVYNKSEDVLTGIISYHRHILKNCFVKRTNNKIKVGDIVLQSDNIIIRVPAQKNYLAPFLWQNLPNDKMGAYITFKPGDLIILGEVNENIDEYSAGLRATDIINKYSALGSCYISAVNVNTDLPNKHYYIKGE